MPSEVFLDTNVLVYAAYPAQNEEWKQEIALGIVAGDEFALSSQVLLEFLNTTTRKRKPGLSLDEARQWIDDFCASQIVAVDEALVDEGIELAKRYRIVFWDGTILAAAHRAGAKTLLTEDLNHGQVYGDVTVINPFLQASH